MSLTRSRSTVVLFALLLLAILIALAASPAGAAPSQPKANWSPCYRELGYAFECTIVQVPLDHSDPGAAAINVAMVRLPAGDPVQRIGSLFLNPGGPGGSGFDFALSIAPFIYTEDVRARFDIVGFDPRGIGRSTAVRCFGSTRQWEPYFTPFAFPITPEEEETWRVADQYVLDACDQRAARIIDNMSTADVARDLDLLRQAVGDEGLTYAGYSYGSYLGVTYANLFPDKVRALVVDAVLDPVAWATGAPGEGDTLPFSYRLRSDAGAMATLEEFFRLCDEGGPTACAFAPLAAQRFAAMAQQLRAAPLVLPLPDGSLLVFTYQDLIGSSLSALYNSFSWPSHAELLATIEFLLAATAAGTEVSPETAAAFDAQLSAFWRELGFITKRAIPQYPNAVEGFPAVSCSDSDNPADFAAWPAASAAAESGYGYFGPIWTWASSLCASWPGAMDSRYAGPFDAVTANPVLVVNTLYDPATRYEGAVTVAGLLPNSRLLTVNGWGHATLFLSACAEQAVGDYLVTGALPAEGTVCYQDWIPFGGSPAAAGFESAVAGRQRLTPATTALTARFAAR